MTIFGACSITISVPGERLWRLRPGNMTLYIDVEDLAAYCKKIVAAGGKIQVEEQEVPGMGAFSLFTDTEGRIMGIGKTAKK